MYYVLISKGVQIPWDFVSNIQDAPRLPSMLNIVIFSSSSLNPALPQVHLQHRSVAESLTECLVFVLVYWCLRVHGECYHSDVYGSCAWMDAAWASRDAAILIYSNYILIFYYTILYCNTVPKDRVRVHITLFTLLWMSTMATHFEDIFQYLLNYLSKNSIYEEARRRLENETYVTSGTEEGSAVYCQTVERFCQESMLTQIKGCCLWSHAQFVSLMWFDWSFFPVCAAHFAFLMGSRVTV